MMVDGLYINENDVVYLRNSSKWYIWECDEAMNKWKYTPLHRPCGGEKMQLVVAGYYSPQGKASDVI